MAKGFRPTANAAVRDNVVILRADDDNAPYHRRVDLEGKSITFTRQDAASYAAVTGPLVYDEAIGTRLDLPLGRYKFAAVTISNFELPFFGRNVKQIYVAQNNAIFLETPTEAELRQFGDLELTALRKAVIAPMLMTSAVQTEPPVISVKQTADSVVVTWFYDNAANGYDIQATLFRSGDIRFSYRQAAKIRAGAVLLTSGDEPWRGERTELGATSDPSGDVFGSPGFVDVTSATLSRIAGSNLLELRLDLAAPVDRSAMNQQVVFDIRIGSAVDNDSIFYVIRADGTDEYQIPTWMVMPKSPAATFDGRTIRLHILQDHLILSGQESPVSVITRYGSSASLDQVAFSARIDTPQRPVRTDFSIASGQTLTGPIGEAFTLSPISVYAAWDQLKAAYSLKDSDWDGVAVYQNFLTDIVFYAGAYSTVGNPGADGISSRSGMGTRFNRTPALMHMNMIGFSPNRDDRAASHVVMHEFGHHWLLFVRFRDGGSNSTMLNPLGGHPAQYVDTRAAFEVYGPDDSSVMGGGTFRTNSNGSFTTSPYAAYSYSWLDLYLMGLASPTEVQPWYYIANSQPALAGAYYPPQNATYSGNRKDVTIEQVISSMGARKPAYPDTQKQFRVLFVLLADPDREPTSDELSKMAVYRELLERNFKTATGGRAEISTAFSLPEPGPRRRAAR